jgi:deazaflavin-dependent oxidoreductase (nitroreductase family)
VAKHIRTYVDSGPSWYLNIRANSEVEAQVGPDRFPATARLATPEERPRLWKKMVSIWPEYDNYQRKVSRQIPVVVIERVSPGNAAPDGTTT